jgi:hypothetical protein
MTEYITLTDLWYKGKYLEVGKIINKENWPPKRVAEFCIYFGQHLGLSELKLLPKFL